MKSMIKLFSMLLVILTLVGCGLKGPLYVPENTNNTSSQPSLLS